MSVDEDDWGRDEYELEMANHAIEEFQTERLQSYYRDHTDLAVKPYDLLDEARKTFGECSSAALVLAMGSIEVGFKSMVLRPIMAGLVHNESLSDFITDSFVSSTRHEDLLRVVNRVLTEYASINLLNVRLDAHSKTAWEEIIEGQKKRNAVLHRAEQCSTADAQVILDLATYLWTVIFPQLLEHIGLHTHDNRIVCTHNKTQYCDHRDEIEAALARAENFGLANAVAEKLRAKSDNGSR